jgi:hypothetical protein
VTRYPSSTQMTLACSWGLPAASVAFGTQYECVRRHDELLPRSIMGRGIARRRPARKGISTNIAWRSSAETFW